MDDMFVPLAKGLMVYVSESEAVIDSLLEEVGRMIMNVLDVMTVVLGDVTVTCLFDVRKVTCLCDVMDGTSSLSDPHHVRRDEGEGGDPGAGHTGGDVLVILVIVKF